MIRSLPQLFLAGALAIGCGGRPAPVQTRHLGDPPPEVPAEYRVQTGDVLRLRFLRADELTGDVTVLPDGRISMPLVGELFAIGATASELRSRIRARYESVLKEPDVEVTIKDYRPSRIYIAGEVGRPGAYPHSKDMTLLRAVTAAGGLSGDAAASRVLVIRNSGAEEPRTFEVDLGDAYDAGDGSADPFLRPQDVIVVPRTRIASAGKAVDDYFDDLLPGLLQSGFSYAIGILAADEVRDRRNNAQ